MLCDKCKKNEAVVFYKESVNGHKKSMALCEHCAAEAEKAGELNKSTFTSGLFKDPFSDMDSIFSSLFGLPQYAKKPVSEAKKCTLCGATFRDLINEGKAGCPECYRVFSEELSETISRIHGTTTHTGGAPGAFKEGRALKDRITSLESELKSAVAAEEYEKAAELRDKLRELRDAVGKDGE